MSKVARKHKGTTQEIQSRREEARRDPLVALGGVHLALSGLSGFTELFDNRMINLEVDRVKRANLALGVDVQSIGLGLTTLVQELQQCVEDLDTAMKGRAG